MTVKENFLQLETEIVMVLKNIFDPEIPVNIYDMGLIYGIDVDEENNAKITMTLTAPNCPMADDLMQEVRSKISGIPDIKSVEIILTFDPSWHRGLMTDEAKLELGML